jgi:hypothetical protein
MSGQHLINRRQKLADFCELRSLENFDFTFNPMINRALIYEFRQIPIIETRV